MKIHALFLFAFTLLGTSFCAGTGSTESETTDSDEGWISLFDGESLDGWQVGENASTFSVEDGTIKVDGPRAHLYYVGDVENADFKNFEFRAQVMTRESANSGIYFHTDYQEGGWPATGYEVQVNQTQGDWKKSGSLYNVINVPETYVNDDEWYETYVKVDGNEVIVKLDGITVVHYTEPENPTRPDGDMQNRVITNGTFALQGHDPNSVIHYRDIEVRPLP